MDSAQHSASFGSVMKITENAGEVSRPKGAESLEIHIGPCPPHWGYHTVKSHYELLSVISLGFSGDTWLTQEVLAKRH